MISVEYETLPHPYSNIKTFVRRIRMKFSSADEEQNIPISIKLSELKCQVCNELDHDDITCTRSRLYSSVARTSPKILVTPTTDAQDLKTTTASTKLHSKVKVCHRCKQI